MKRDNVQLAKKNLKDIEKMLIVLTTVRDDYSPAASAKDLGVGCSLAAHRSQLATVQRIEGCKAR